jgi:thiol reductant ABC exporter CydC subunit
VTAGGRRNAVRRVVAFGRPVRGRFALAALAGALALGSGVGLMATSAWLISRAAQHPPILFLTVAIVGVRAFGLARGAARYAERLVSHDGAFGVLRELRITVWERLERIAPAGLPAYRSGDLLARLVADVDAQQDLFLRVLVPSAVAALVGAATLGLLVWLLPAAALVLLGGMLTATVAVPWLAGRTGRRAERRVAPARGALSAAVVELLRSMPDLIGYGAADRRLARVAALDQDLVRAEASSAGAAGLVTALAGLGGGLTVCGALVVGVAAVRGGALEGVALAVVVLTPLAAFEAVGAVAQVARHAERARRSAERVVDVLDRPEPVREPAVPDPLPDAPYTLRVHRLRATWPDAPAPALDGVDLELRPGRRVAVVGPSGSGKSTLVAVLLRFLDPSGGRVTLNRADITALAGDDVRRVVQLCAQDAHLFDTTIGENILLARRSASASELRTALASARLLDWVRELPDGLGTRVGEHGSRISGGQRQRIALARAQLANPPILLLDEPAEHLDTAAADALTGDLLTATAGRTTLLVTHRLAKLGAVDEVVVLDGGRVVQRGTHAHLLGTLGPYRRMWDLERWVDSGPGAGGAADAG